MSKKETCLVGVTFYEDTRNFLEQNKVKSLSFTLDWYILYFKKTQGKIRVSAILSDKEDKQKTLRISQEAKEFILSNKVANSISYTINIVLMNAKRLCLEVQAD